MRNKCARIFTNPTRVSVIFASNTKYGTNTCEEEETSFLDETSLCSESLPRVFSRTAVL